MALALSKKEDQLVKLENQKNTVKQLAKLESSVLTSYAYELYQATTYHFVQYNVKEDKKTCFKLAFLFSKHSEFFLGRKRSEIQLDNESVTLSTNDWIKIKPLPSCEMDFYVEYYMSTYENFPVMIFFRIKKSIDNHEAKLKNYLNYLLGVPLLTNGSKQEMIQNIVPVGREVILQLTHVSDDDFDDPMEVEKLEPPSTQLMNIEDDGIFTLVAFASVVHNKGTYITLLTCGMVVTWYCLDTIQKQENNAEYNHTY